MREIQFLKGCSQTFPSTAHRTTPTGRVSYQTLVASRVLLSRPIWALGQQLGAKKRHPQSPGALPLLQKTPQERPPARPHEGGGRRRGRCCSSSSSRRRGGRAEEGVGWIAARLTSFSTTSRIRTCSGKKKGGLQTVSGGRAGAAEEAPPAPQAPPRQPSLPEPLARRVRSPESGR